jgi:HSP20 family molecular chaperone IbpA
MNFEEIMKEMEAMRKKMTEGIFDDFDALEERFKSGDLEGGWQFEPFERPGMKGFIARGFFTTPHPLERPTDLLPPIRPRPRGPREPFYDINEESHRLVLLIELPGVEEQDIELTPEPRSLKIKAGDFQTEIDLSKWVVDLENMTQKYNNGVLKVIIPREELKETLI